MKRLKHFICTFTTPGAYIPDFITLCKSLWYLYFTPILSKKDKLPSKLHKRVNSLLINAGKTWTKRHFSQLSQKLKEYDGIWTKKFDNTPYNHYTYGKYQTENDNGTKTLLYLTGEIYAKRLRTSNPEYDKAKIVYTLDKHNFRVHPRPNYSETIACFGCSNTFGEGLPDEETWPFLLQEKLKNIKVATFNYGICGVSCDHICRSIYTYLQEHTPKYIVCLFPDLFRNEFYDMANQKVVTMSPFVSYKQHQIDKEYEGYNLLFNDVTGTFNFIKNFKFIETLCRLKDVKLLWHTWSPTLLNIDYTVLAKFIGQRKDCIIKNNTLYNIVDEHNLIHLTDKARDGFHNGRKYNDVLSTGFANLILS